MENIRTNNRFADKELVDGIDAILPKECLDKCFEAIIRKGWFQIVWKLCQDIKELCNEKEIPINIIEIQQIKEKFGSLRFYVNHDNIKKLNNEVFLTRFYLLISEAEIKSHHTCEICSSSKSTETRRNKGEGYIQTLCEECRQKEEAIKNEQGD